MFLVLINNIASLIFLIFANVVVFYCFAVRKDGKAISDIRALIIINNGIPIFVKLASASFIARMIDCMLLRSVMATIIIYYNVIALVFLSNSFFNIEKNQLIYEVFSNRRFNFIVLQTMIIFKRYDIWALSFFYFITDDSIFFVEGCAEMSFLDNFF